MCGFAGLFLINNLKKNELKKMSTSIKFRGPDDYGEFINLEKQIAFFHNRLSIQDISSAGHQPMYSFSKRFVISFNGEIYNHLELRKIIEDNYHNEIIWNGNSDTETLVNLFELFSIKKAISLCVGVFSFALWDQKENILHLVRDRIGEKPLYYGFNNNIFFFGSDLATFKSSSYFYPKIDLESLKLYFKLNYIPSPYSIYKNIHKLSPGSVLSISLNERKINIKKYWNLKKNINKFSYEDAINISKERIEKSVSQQMISDVSIGSFLSGGIDSSLVTYYMQKNSMKKINTFNVSFDDKNYNESEYASNIAKFIGTNHNTIHIKNSDYFNSLENINNVFSEPFADSSQIVTSLISNKAKENVSVILSGDGGDEAFAGYNRHLIAKKILQINYLFPFSIRKYIFGILPYLSNSKLLKLNYYLLKLLNSKYSVKNIEIRIQKLSNVLLSKNNNYAYLKMFINPSNNLFHFDQDLEKNLIDKMDIKINELDDIVYNDIKYYLSDDIMCKVDRSSMFSSLETRMPLADSNILEHTSYIDYNHKVKNGEIKHILKKITSDLFPKNFFNRPKMGFEIPLDNLLRTTFRDWAEDLLSDKNLSKYDFINKKNTRLLWKNHMNNIGNNQHELWSILMFCNWSKSN